MNDGIPGDEPVREWRPASSLPTPGIPLIVRLDNGSEVEAIRPSYVVSYNADPDYRDPRGNRLSNVKEWSIK